MAGQPGALCGHDRPEIIRLDSVPGFVVLDLPDAAVCAGGTRLAPDVTLAEVALLARAMTYKFAALGDQVGGAKAGVLGDSGDRVARAGQMARYCAEIRPLADAGRFLTGPDMGTFEEDFKPLRVSRPAPTAFAAVMAGVAFEDLLTGFGVAVAAETALRAGPGGGWEGRSVAIEGFGRAGGGVAREVTRRGGRVVGLSTAAGCVADPSGLDVAESLPSCVRVVAPAANVPYTREGADALHRRGIAALPDFVCNSGAVIGYRSALEASPEQVLASVANTIEAVIAEALSHPCGPLAGACERAAAFLRSWCGDPPAPPFAV